MRNLLVALFVGALALSPARFAMADDCSTADMRALASRFGARVSEACARAALRREACCKAEGPCREIYPVATPEAPAGLPAEHPTIALVLKMLAGANRASAVAASCEVEATGLGHDCYTMTDPVRDAGIGEFVQAATGALKARVACLRKEANDLKNGAAESLASFSSARASSESGSFTVSCSEAPGGGLQQQRCDLRAQP